MISGASVIKQVRRYNWMISPASKTTSRTQFRINPACNSQKCHKNSEQTSVINNFCAALHTRKLIRAEAAEKKLMNTFYWSFIYLLIIGRPLDASWPNSLREILAKKFLRVVGRARKKRKTKRERANNWSFLQLRLGPKK